MIHATIIGRYDTPCNCVRCTAERAYTRSLKGEVEAGPFAGCVPYIYKPKTAEAKAKEEAEPLSCPVCGGEVGWDKNGAYELGGVRFTERIQVCTLFGAGCWSGTVALFPWGEWFDHKPRAPCRMAAEAAERESTGGSGEDGT